MFKATVEVTNPGLITAYEQQLINAPEVVQTLVTRAVNEERDRLLVDFRREPPPPTYPLVWTSERQRRAFFASNGFGRGIPTTRSHEMVNAWHLLVVFSGNRLTEIAIENNDPTHDFVTGRNRQRMHVITGWYDEFTLIDRSRRILTSKVETALIKGFYSIEEAR